MERQRTISQEAWVEATRGMTLRSDELGDVIDRCMAELKLGEIRLPSKGCRPWLANDEECTGAMWPGAIPLLPKATRWKDGSWLFRKPHCYHRFIRLAPAAEDSEVQYGFCPVRWNRLEELCSRELEKRGGRPIGLSSFEVCTNEEAYTIYSVDNMLGAATELADPSLGVKDGKRFRVLIGRDFLDEFRDAIKRSAYARSDVLIRADPGFREAILLVACRVNPNLLTPTTQEDVRWFCEHMDLSPAWEGRNVVPTVFSVVMPRPIFDAICQNLEKDIPPIVPQYVTANDWMFNGRWSDPCTGLALEGGLCQKVWPRAQKILGGVVNLFNTDSPGGASFWPIDRNPSSGWVGAFVAGLEALGRERMPASPMDRADLAMVWARKVPIAFDMRDEGGSYTRHMKLVDLKWKPSAGRPLIKEITLRGCDMTGQKWIGNPVVVSLSFIG